MAENPSQQHRNPESSDNYTYEYNPPEMYAYDNDIAAPAPVQNPSEGPTYRRESLEDELRRERSHGSSLPRVWSSRASSCVGDVDRTQTPPPSRMSTHSSQGQGSRRTVYTPRARDSASYDQQYQVPADFTNLNEVRSPEPVENPNEQPIFRHHSLEERSARAGLQSIPSPTAERRSLPPLREKPATVQLAEKIEQIPKLLTELYTLSYLIFFALLGTLARLGLNSLTNYTGAPVTFGVLWSNFTGTMVLGFLAELSSFLNDSVPTEKAGGSGGESDGTAVAESTPPTDEESTGDEAHSSSSRVRSRPTPLYIGLATGFCGSFTSFSTFMLDVFLALSNSLPAPQYHEGDADAAIALREPGLDVMALLAVILLTVGMCLSALKLGAHVAILFGRFSLRLPRQPPWLDKCAVMLGFGGWIGAVIMAILPPDRPGGPSGYSTWDQETWRGEVLFALVFAPLGCLSRFYISVKLNAILATFPLGTFVVNLLGTAILGMAWDLQHAPCGVTGGSRIGNQVLQGVIDGFCGCLTTVSTWVTELSGLRRGHAYLYGCVSVIVSLAALILILGTMKWTIGWHDCV